jgi:flagellar hook-length control protein FliK
MAAPEQAEEKSAGGGAGSLFTNMMGCFRALLSSASPDGMNVPGEVPPAAGMTDDWNQEPPPGAEPGVVNTETGPNRTSSIRVDAPVAGQDIGEEPKATTDRSRFTSASVAFFLMASGLSTDMPATPGLGADQGITTGHLDDAEGLAGTASLMSQEAVTTGEPTGLNDGTMSAGSAASRSAIEEAREPAASTVSAPVDSSAVDPAGKEDVAAKPMTIAADAGQAEVARAVRAAVAAQVTGAGTSGADRSTGSAANEQSISSPPTQSAAGNSAEEGLAFPAGYPRVPITTSLLQTVGGPRSADLRPDNDAGVKSGAKPQGADAPERRGASASPGQSTGSVATGGEKSVEARLAVPDDLFQKVAGKVVPPANDQTGSQQQAIDRAAVRQGNIEVKADQNLVSQTGGESKSPSPLKTVTVADGPASAAESQVDPASRARMRSILERGAQDGASVASSSGMARDAQASSQSASPARDVKAPAFMFEVAERISAVVAGARGEVTIQLKPDQFGRMNIVAESGASGILARITTESASLKQYLENNLPVLQQALQGQGLKVERIDVVVQEGLQQQSMNQWQHNPGHAPGRHDPGGNSGFAVPARPQAAQPANEITLDAVILGALHPHSTFHTIA